MMEAAMNTRVATEVQTASLLVERHIALVIPSYQRPYVWPSEDVLKLLEDIIAAFDAKEPHYYIGTVLTSASTHENPEGVFCVYELVDGQQRSTTLMLLSLAFSKLLEDSSLARFTAIAGQPRLTFDIRDQVQELLSHWVGLENSPFPGDEVIENNPYLKHMNEAYRVATDRLKGFQEKHKDDDRFEKLGEFIYKNVKWVNNTMPAGTDLNRLFATMNTSGVQLEQTDILKSLLLKAIPAHEKPVYDAIWQACENLNNYFERNLKKLFPKARWHSIQYEDLAHYAPERFGFCSEGDSPAEGGKGFTIAQLAAGAGEAAEYKPKGEKVKKEDEGEQVYCRSIISFGLLLMHTYRIFRHQRKQDSGDIDTRLNDAYLSRSFDNFFKLSAQPGDDAKAFIELLWQVRFQFDRWVVKWVELPDDDREYLRLTYISHADSSGTRNFNRTVRENSNGSQLQSVRYFTGEFSAQNWLTPFLGHLIQTCPSDIKAVEVLLETIDNTMSLATGTQKEASFALLDGMGIPVSVSGIKGVCAELQQAHGTSFEHYWFQKLEYILWRNRESLDCFNYPGKEINKYRIVSRNSVEHVHPQNEEYKNELVNDWLHCFGNLALLSPGENSSYSHQTVGKKRQDFKDKPGYDSLKLAHIFHNITETADWNQHAIEQHQNDMLNLIETHYREQSSYGQSNE